MNFILGDRLGGPLPAPRGGLLLLSLLLGGGPIPRGTGLRQGMEAACAAAIEAPVG